jgi:L-2-hydroxycarboxylate dehydrogenase (NAD+)
VKLEIQSAVNLSNEILKYFGLTHTEAHLITENLIEAELTGKTSHGLMRLSTFRDKIDENKINISASSLKIIKETLNSIHIDGQFKIGISIIYQSMNRALEIASRSGFVCVGIKDIEFSGFIGAYARKATEKDLIFIGFNNSTGKIVPYGSLDRMWGTNPITIGIPTNNYPVILDMSSSQITWGDLLISKNANETIKKGLALDKNGKVVDEPLKVIQGGGLLPIAEYKGSGLAFIIELLAGGLTGSRIGYQVPGGWGSFYILIDPNIFRALQDFKNDIDTAINELKTARKTNPGKEIFFAGEQSSLRREKHLKQGFINFDDNLYAILQKYF